MPRESGLELKVGAFVLAALVALVAFVCSVSDFSFFQKGSAYSVVFHFANGLKKGAPVRLAGVDAGIVRALTVFVDPVEQKTRVRADLWLEHDMLIPVDSRVYINQLGILGEKYVEIMPGTAANFWTSATVALGDDPVPMEEILTQVGSISTKLDVTLNEINQKILTEQNAQALAESLQNFAAISTALRSGNGTVGQFLTDQRLYQNLEELTADLKANPWKLFYRPKKK